MSDVGQSLPKWAIWGDVRFSPISDRTADIAGESVHLP